MGDYGYKKYKTKRMLYGAIAIIFALLLFVIESKADMEPAYNISVKIDSSVNAYLNEKIEVYCEKDGQFYMIIDLNKSNRYEYKKMFENGVYTFWARVRYDVNEEYTILPDSQAIELTYKNNNILNEIVFMVDGAHEDQELHSHLTGNESEPELWSEEKVFTIDDIDELYEIQESMIGEAEAAFTEQEAWERNHNFFSQKVEIHETSSAQSNETLSMHVYPEAEYEGTKEQYEEFLDKAPADVDITQETDVEVLAPNNPRTTVSVAVAIIAILVLFVMLLVVLVGGEKLRNRHE